jgi:hypothetical protein
MNVLINGIYKKRCRWREKKTRFFLTFALVFLSTGMSHTSHATEAKAIEVSENHRHLQRADGTPFFYLGDTAWCLFHRLTREEADLYLQDRADKGFSVIQAVALSELDGLTEPNAYGELPLIDRNPATPNEKYFEHVDYVVRRANELGMTIGLLPSWGRYWRDGNALIFTPESALTYAQFLGARYRDADIIWILGGDSNVRSDSERSIMDALAKGLKRGDNGKHLITFHPRGPGRASEQLRDAEWLDFYMNQSSHAAANLDTGLYVEYDRKLDPSRPTIDGEPRYEGIPVGFYNHGHNPIVRFEDDDIRQAAWWSTLAGAAGFTYGNNNIWQMWTPERKPAIGANVSWKQALNDPGAQQVGYLRRFMEEHEFQTLVAAQGLILDGPTTGAGKIRAARSTDGKRIIVYSPQGDQVTLDLKSLTGSYHNQTWFNPRYGTSFTFRKEQSFGIQSFTPPSSGQGKDWVLVLETTSD